MQMQQEKLTCVHQFWQQSSNHDFRIWKQASLWQMDWQGESHSDIDQELTYRRIQYSTQQDQLRWGHTPKGTFTTKEAHQLRYSELQANRD